LPLLQKKLKKKKTNQNFLSQAIFSIINGESHMVTSKTASQNEGSIKSKN